MNLLMGIVFIAGAIIAAIIIADILTEKSRLYKGEEFYSNFAPRKSEIIDIYVDDNQPYVKWRHIGDDAHVFTSSAKYFLDTHHVCW